MRAPGSNGPQRPRAPELDLLRLAAAVAVAVLLYHYTWAASESGLGGPRYPVAITAWSRYGFLGIELFFLISGLVIVNSVGHRSAAGFAAGRAVRLYPGYWAAVTVTALVLAWSGGPMGDLYTPSRYLLNLTMLTGFVHGTYLDSVYRTLTAELSFYAVVWLALVARRRRDLVVVLGAWLAISAVNDRLLHHGEVTLLLATRFAPYFVTGACIALLTDERTDAIASWRRPLAWATAAVAIVLSVRTTVIRIDGANSVLFAPGSIRVGVGVALVLGGIAVVALVATGRLRSWGQPWMTTAALVTYPLYLIHSNVGLVLFDRWAGRDRWVLLVAVTAVVTALATGIHLLVERPLAGRLTRALKG